jgi:O-methyltransferase
VRFLVGWFSETLPTAPIEKLAVLRLDGDMYSSTMDALDALYDKVSPGGYVIVDDYGAVPACAQAIHDFRDARGITDPIEQIDWAGVFWRKA